MFNRYEYKEHLYIRRGAYSKEACEHAIRTFEKRIDLHNIGRVGRRQIDYEKKKCTEIFLGRTEYTLFEDTLQSCLKDYVELNPYLKESVEAFDFEPDLKIQKYLPGEAFYFEHCENGGNIASIRRLLAWMVYLNDVTDGGYTHFPQQKRKFQPRRGDVLIWPAHFTHTHYGVTSNTQIKYIATGWCSFMTNEELSKLVS